MKDETTAAAPLPEGWQRVKLGEVCELVGGGTPSRGVPDYFIGNIPWITPTDLDKNRISVITTAKQHLSAKGLANSSARLIPVGSVLLTSRAGIGNIAIAGCELCTNQGFINFVCGSRINNLYLAHWLQANVSLLEELASGTTFKEISKGTVREIAIELPPVEEQEVIASHIRMQFAALETARAAAEAQLATLRILPAALLRETFTRKWLKITPPPPSAS